MRLALALLVATSAEAARSVSLRAHGASAEERARCLATFCAAGGLGYLVAPSSADALGAMAAWCPGGQVLAARAMAAYALPHDDEVVRGAATYALGRVIASLSAEEGGVAVEIVAALAAQALKDRAWRVQIAAMFTIADAASAARGANVTGECIAALRRIALSRDGDAYPPCYAMDMLGDVARRSAEGPEDVVAQSIAALLGRPDARGAFRVLGEIVATGGRRARGDAVHTLLLPALDAAPRLEEWASNRTAAQLLRGLSHPQPEVRGAACMLLGCAGARASREVALDAAAALSALALADASEDVRRASVEGLGRIARTAARPGVRAACVAALSGLRGAVGEVALALVKELELIATGAPGSRAAVDCVEALSNMSGSRDRDAHDSAVNSLTSIAKVAVPQHEDLTRLCLPALCNAGLAYDPFEWNSRLLRQVAETASDSMREAVVAELSGGSLRSANVHVRTSAVRILREVGLQGQGALPAQAVSALTDVALRDEISDVAEAAAAALGDVARRGAHALPSIEALASQGLRHEAALVRMAAVRGLAAAPGPDDVAARCVAALSEGAADESEAVALAACDALLAIGASRGALREACVRGLAERALPSRSARVAVRAAGHLGSLAVRREALQAMALGDAAEASRLAATSALAHAGARQASPSEAARWCSPLAAVGLRDESPAVRAEVSWLLARVAAARPGGDCALAVLARQALEDVDAQVRAAAAAALRDIAAESSPLAGRVAAYLARVREASPDEGPPPGEAAADGDLRDDEVVEGS